MEQVRNFFIRPDIVYTMPDMKDEITFWEKGVKTKQQEYYLTMFLREAHIIYSQSSDHTNKVQFFKFCGLRLRKALLMKDSPKDQCKCMIHEIYMNKLKGLFIAHGSSKSLHMVLCDSSLNSFCWQSNCEVCENGKILHASWKEWCLLRLIRVWKSFNAK